jgi:hypothetical protein
MLGANESSLRECQASGTAGQPVRSPAFFLAKYQKMSETLSDGIVEVDCATPSLSRHQALQWRAFRLSNPAASNLAFRSCWKQFRQTGMPIDRF